MEETLLTVEDAVLTVEEEVEKKPAPRRRTTRSRSTAAEKAAVEQPVAPDAETVAEQPVAVVAEASIPAASDAVPVMTTAAIPEPVVHAGVDNEKASLEPVFIAPEAQVEHAAF